MDLAKFKNPSATHKVSENGPHFSITPISDSESDVRSFQNIAKEAAAYSGDKFDVKPHKTSQFGFRLFDSVTFIAK